MDNNPILEQVSEIYNRIQLYTVISNIKEELKTTTDLQYHRQLQEALAYAEKRLAYII